MTREKKEEKKKPPTATWLRGEENGRMTLPFRLNSNDARDIYNFKRSTKLTPCLRDAFRQARLLSGMLRERKKKPKRDPLDQFVTHSFSGISLK